MEIFHMADILSLLHLPVAPQGKSSYYIQCPCCDEHPHNRHLNINLKKEVFRCPRCGISGGIFDLYSLYTGTPRDKVRKELVESLGTPKIVVHPQKKAVIEEKPSCPLMDIESRHATYSALLERLSLSADHRENLLGRGLTDTDIKRLGYKTTPIVGMGTLSRQLQSEGYYLGGIPGFFRNDSGNWTFIQEKRGIMIPVRNEQGLIQGLQIRRDDVKKRKFRWCSSIGELDGCGAEAWTHLAGPVRPVILLIEGPMKADIVNALTGLTVLAVPGVNALSQLKLSLEILRLQGVEKIMIAFDMDFLVNPHVQKGYQALRNLLEEMGFLYGCYTWDPRYKGLDDYIWEHCFQRRRQLIEKRNY